MSEANSTFIEAENFTLNSGFSIVKSGIASGGAWVQHTSGATASMSTTLVGQAGTYDLVITYFDENDGSAESIVKIDGKTIESWLWSQDLGSANANRETLTSHVVKGIELSNAATLTIEGKKDGKEPLRIDKVELIASSVSAARSDTNPMPAFPGAQGFGATAVGGRGGQIVKVKNLDESGVGSLRWALEDLEGPRIVVFEVGGVIALKDQISVNGQVTIAGQTAPGGITITGARLRVVEGDVIVRGLKIRPGDGDGDQPDNRDGISVGVRGSVVDRVIVDSNSISWTVDEGLATWGSPKNVTFSNNLVAEALRYSIHPEGRHSMGMLIGDESSNVTAVGNLLAHNQFRNPTVKNSSTGVEFINNVIYNYGPHGFLGQAASTAHVIGNVYIAGPDSSKRPPIRFTMPETGAAYYLSNNIGAIGGPAVSKVSTNLAFKPSDVTILPTSDVVDHVLTNVGARAQGLDPIDSRIIQSVIDRTGSIIDSPDDVGGYQDLPSRSPLPDQDGDGIPDLYEPIVGSDAAEFDALGDANGDGYSNIENYINGLLDGSVPSAVIGGGSGAGASVGNGSMPGRGNPPESGVPKADPIRYEIKGLQNSLEFQNEFDGHVFDLAPINETKHDMRPRVVIFGRPSQENDLVTARFDENDKTKDASNAICNELDLSFAKQQGTMIQLMERASSERALLWGVPGGEMVGTTLSECICGHEPLRIDAFEVIAEIFFG